MVVLFIPDSAYTFEEKVQQLNKVRLGRSCVEGLVGDGEVEGHPFLDSYLPFSFIVQIGIIAAGILVIILLLGVLKGLMGLFVYSPIGMLGLGYLVDVPRVLNKYQENELAAMRVVYDTVGWPIHPQTGKRTVRAVTKRMEFCANVVFFIAFPLVIIISIFTACFAHKTYDEDDGGECYQKVNTIMLSDTPSLKVLAKGCTTKGAGGSYKSGGKEPCPTKISVTSGACSKACKHLAKKPSTPTNKSSSTPTNSKSKSSSSGKSAAKSSKSSIKSDSSAKSKKPTSKSSATKGSPKSKSASKKSNKSKNSKSKAPAKGPKKAVKAKSPSNTAYKDDDSAEDADTQYVLAQMHQSEISLKK